MLAALHNPGMFVYFGFFPKISLTFAEYVLHGHASMHLVVLRSR
jgi:hypothetical protein